MRFMIGYQLQQDSKLIEEILRSKEHIYEVYFAWGAMPSGRGVVSQGKDLLPHEALQMQQQQLRQLHEAGIGLNLLLNANCYGKHSLSRNFLMQTGDLLDYLQSDYGVQSVTTTSPVLAHFIKENFPLLEIRASVNMEIGTIEGMEYLEQFFDGFYYKRELNRDLPQVQKLKNWCDKHEKKLYMLANSGCLNFCSARQFHDNLVAHEQEIEEMDNGVQYKSICSQFLSSAHHRTALLQHLNCVRPEEIHIFEPYVTAAKIASRVSLRPEAILHAYIQAHYDGNLLDLLEPNHAAAFYPQIIDNSRLPPDYNSHVACCEKQCETCKYCKTALEHASVQLNEGGILDVNQCND